MVSPSSSVSKTKTDTKPARESRQRGRPIGVRQELAELQELGSLRIWLRSQLQDTPGWLTSLVIHAVIVILLALITIAPPIQDVLPSILSAVPVDHVNTMGIPPDDPEAGHGEPPAWVEFRAIAKDAGVAAPIEPISKWDFYKAVEGPDHVLTIQTADQALWANVLLTVGCRVG